MYSRDFILRMIEMLGELIAGILGLIKGGKLDEASKKLDKAYSDFLKEDAAFFHALPIENLTDVLIKEHDYTAGHLEILSELFRAEAELQAANNNKEAARDFYAKALKLYEYVVDNSTAFSFEQQNKLNELQQKLVNN